MKKLNFLIIGFAFMAILPFSFCASNDEASEEKSDSTIVQLEDKMDKIESADTTNLKSNESNSLGKEYSARYICPDHCKGSGSDKAGKCSACGMDLMENPHFQNR